MMFLSDIDLLMQYIIPILLFWCISKESGFFVSLTLGFGNALNQFLKNTFCIYRPWIRDAQIEPYGNSKLTATGYSFPSGHSIMASSVYGGVSQQYWKKRALAIAMIVVALLTGFSRNYLGCHTPQDVAVGLTEGVLAIIVVYFVTKWLAKDGARDKWIFIGGALFAIAMVVYSEFKPYPMDYIDGKLIVDPESMKLDCYSGGGLLLGVVLGWFLERRFVCFEIRGKWWQRMLRFVLGVIVVFAIYVGLSTAFAKAGMSKKAIKFIVQFLMEMTIFFFGPLVIKFFAKQE